MGSIAPAALVTPHIPLPTSAQGNALQARADTAYSTEWDVQEQANLDGTLARYPADRHPPLERYVRAAAGLPKKNVRDVALRVAWMRATAAARKRKAVDEANSKKQVRRERGQSIFAVQPKTMGSAVGPHPMAQHSMGMGVAPAANMGMIPGMTMTGSNMMQPPGMAFAQPIVPMAPPLVSQLDDHGAGTVGVVGGPLSQLLEQNYAILNQFKQNMEVYKVNENTELLVRFRDNILTVLNQMNAMQGVMQQMPPLPVRLNVELANNFLPKAVANGVCQMPYMAAPMHSMPPMPVMSQQGSAAMPQASMPYGAVSAPAPAFAAPAMAPHPFANGISAPAPAAPASVGLPTSMPTAGLPTALPASMPAMSIPQTGMPAISVPQAGMPIPGSMPFSGVLPPQPGMPVPGSLPYPGSLASQAVAVKQEPVSQAQPVQVSMPMHIKMEPGLPVPGSMAMPVGPAASAALFRPPPPVNTAYNLPPSIPMVPGGPAPVKPGASMAASIAVPAVQLPHVAHLQQHQLQQAQQLQAQHQQGRQKGPPVSGSLPAQTPYNVLFPPSSAVQPAAAQDPSAPAGGLYDVLASITANTPGMLPPATSQAFSAPQLASVSAPQLATAAQAAAAQVLQPQHPAAPVTGMQPGVMPPGGNAPTGAPVPYPVIQTGHLQQGMPQQQSMTRPQAVVQGPPHSLVMPVPLPYSQAALVSAPLPYTAQVQGQAAVPKAPAHPSIPAATSSQAPQQQQQQQQPVPPARATTAAPDAAPSAAVTAPPVVVAPQSKALAQQAPQPVASLANKHGTGFVQQAQQLVGVPADIAQSQGNSSHSRPAPKAVPKQASQLAVVVANAQPPTAPAPMSSPAKAPAAAASPAPSAQQQKWAAAPTQPAQPPLAQQQAPKAAAAPATSAPSTQTQAPAAVGVATANASIQKAGPSIGTRSSSAMSPGRPQRATRSMAAKR